MNKKFMLIIFLAVALSFSFCYSLFAQETTEQTPAQTEVKQSPAGSETKGEAEGTGPRKVKDATILFLWTVIAAIFGLVIAALGGAWCQSKAMRTACNAIGRNPAAADSIRGILILGLALIESLVIYVLLIDFIIIGNWGKYTW